jgi:transposase-like protein
MAEVRAVGVAGVQRHMRQVGVAVHVVQQAARALPGAEAAERRAHLLLEQVQEAAERQVHLRRAVFGRQRRRRIALDAVHHRLDARVQPPRRQRTAKEQFVELRRHQLQRGALRADVAPHLAHALHEGTDDQAQENFYRRLLNYSSLDSVPDQDFLVSDRISTTELIAFGTGYELTEGDTVFNAIFHISRDYYNYIESVQLAVFGNINPFAQPSPIKSNVSGTGNPLGIFTCLVYDRDTTIIMR